MLIPQAVTEEEIKQIIKVTAEAEPILGMIFQRVIDASKEVVKQVAAFDLGEKKKKDKVALDAEKEKKKKQEEKRKADREAKERSKSLGAGAKTEMSAFAIKSDAITPMLTYADTEAVVKAKPNGDLPFVVRSAPGVKALTEGPGVKASMGVFRIQFPGAISASTTEKRGRNPFSNRKAPQMREMLLAGVNISGDYGDKDDVAVRMLKSVSLWGRARM